MSADLFSTQRLGIKRASAVIVLVMGIGIPRASAMSLEDALVAAYSSNPQLLAERARLREVDESIAQAHANWRPTAQITAEKGLDDEEVSGGTPSQNQLLSAQTPLQSYGLSISQSLYRGGRTIAETKEAMAKIRSERARLISVEQKVFVTVVTDYCDLVRDSASASMNRNNAEYLREKASAVSAEFKAGAASKTDVALAEAAYEQAAATSAISDSTELKSRENFRRDAGVDAGQVEYPASPLIRAVDVKSAEVAAETQNPDVLSAEYRAEGAEMTAQKLTDEALPDLALVGTAEHLDGATFRGSHENVLAVMLKLTIPIYSGGSLESRVRAQKQEAVAESSDLAQVRAAAIASAVSYWHQSRASSSAMNAYFKQIKANELALEGTQHQESSGERTFLDVLNAVQALLQSRLNLNTAHHDKVVAEISLAQSMGLATARALSLRVKYYDPVDNFEHVADKWFGFGIDQ